MGLLDLEYFMIKLADFGIIGHTNPYQEIKIMEETTSHIPTERGSDRSFGIVFSIVFLLIAIYPLIISKGFDFWEIIVSKDFNLLATIVSQELNYLAMIISAILLLLAFIFPKILSFPNKLWFKFGMLLGAIVSPIVMALIYFIAVLPTGLIMRILGKDLLKQRLDKNAKSYWIKRSEPLGSMKNQF
mgnify:CR=1 FL=1